MTHIQILCPTYGRPRRLEELVACFLKQHHTDSSLTIVNDHPGQILYFSHPRVSVINLPRRCPSFGQKRHMMLEMADPGLVTYWDDDDIYLPNYLSYSLENIKRFKTMVGKHQTQWVDGGHRLYRIAGSPWMNTVLADRDILLSVGGFDAIHNGTCVPMIQRLLLWKHLISTGAADGLAPSFIYRHKNGLHHVSMEDPANAHASMDIHADQSLMGDIELLPHWHDDYRVKALASWDAVQAVSV
jgi:hypothetical protein